MKYILIIILPLLFSGCSAFQKLPDVNEENAQSAAEYINLHSGLIQNTTAQLVRVAILAIPEGTDKQKYINMAHDISFKLNNLIANNQFDAAAIRKAFKIEDPLVGAAIALAGEFLIVEINQAKKNGYVNFVASFLESTSLGISDGTVQ